ncbi:MAG: DUF4388 domain-containing protein [Acidobacteriota bacterium]
MSLNGKLEDVSLADVMQFVHLGRRTGTLSLSRSGQDAEIGFHRGQIVSASSASSPRLADLLVAKGMVPEATLEEMLRIQSSEQPRRSLGQVLVTTGALAFDDIRQAVTEQIEETVFELVTWTTGSFEFALDELKPNEDIAMYPGDVIPKLDLNTQMLLLDASRVMDEAKQAEAEGRPVPVARGRQRPEVTEPAADMEHGGATAEAGPLGEAMALSGVSGVLEDMDFELPIESEEMDILPEAAHRRMQIVSPDRRIADELETIIQREIAQVVRVPLREAGTRLPGEPTPTIVVLDMREGHHTLEDLLAIRRSRPRSSAIAVVDSPELTTKAFEGGAVAALSADPVAIAACFHSLIRTLQDAGPVAAGSGSRKQKAGFARLRRVLADIRSGLLSATMALNLMHIISESVERAVLFLVRKDSLSALGAFGFDADGRPLAEVTRSLALPLEDENVLTRCLADGQPRSIGFDGANLPEAFASLLGRPRNGQIVVFPVMGAERVISIVYTDNGSSHQAIEDIELLELATAQVGVAFENELLRRQIESQ